MPFAPLLDAVRTLLRALRTGDRDLLASVALPHPELGRLLANPPRALVGAGTDLDLAALELPGERSLVTARLGDQLHLFVVRATELGPRLDLRHQIAATRPDDERRTAARAFYRGLLRGDVPLLRSLAYDTHGIEALGATDGAPGELDVEAAVQALGLCELGLGEPFTVPGGVQFVSAHHLELGIVVLSGLSTTGEIPFLLRPRDGTWKVIAFHFLQAAAQEARHAPVVTSRR